MLIFAWVIGTWRVFFSRKGLALHRATESFSLLLMTATAILALFIHVRNPNSTFAGLSSFHLFVPRVLSMVVVSFFGAISRQLGIHRFGVLGLHLAARTIPSLVNIFLGNGISHQIFFAH